MSYFTAFLILGLAVVAAGLAAWAVGRGLSVEGRRRQHEVGNPVFLQVGVMLSVLLAFVFSEVWGEYNVAALAINGECGALHGAAMLADALPQGRGASVERAIGAYATTVARVEWPAMARRRASPEAVAAFRTVLETAAHLQVERPSDIADQNRILALLTAAHADRETRTYQVGQGLPDAVWVVLTALCAVLIAFVLMAGVEGAGHIVLVVAFTASTVSVLVLLGLLDYPFEGALALGPADFVKTAADTSGMVGAG